MDSAKLNDWMQIVGIFALVASLIFVGLQVKQAQEIAESESYQSRASVSIELTATQASSPEYMSALAKLYADNDAELTAQEAVTVEYFVGAELVMFENHHYQFEAGYLPDEHWERNLVDLQCLLSLPRHREILSAWTFRQSFQAVITEIMADVVTNPSDCWE